MGHRRLKGTDVGLISESSHLPLPGLKPPQDLEAKEVTPRTALLTWTAPDVPPTGYLLSFDTPGGQIQVPYCTGHPRLSARAARFGGATLALRVSSWPPADLSLVCLQEILLPAGTTSHRLLRLFPSTFYSAQLRAVWDESLTPPVSTSFTTGTGSGVWASGAAGV